MEFSSLLTVTPIYIALLGLLFVLFTLRVGLYRVKSNILIGNGDDEKMLKIVRGQGNFIETAPMALFLLITMEILGASSVWLHSLGAAFVLGRILHYIGLTEMGPQLCRPMGMMATLLTILISTIWVLINAL